LAVRRRWRGRAAVAPAQAAVRGRAVAAARARGVASR
jgi:hypothetical protein